MRFEQFTQVAPSAAQLDNLLADPRFDRFVHPLVELWRLLQRVQCDFARISVIGTETKPETEPKGGQTITPANFFPLFVGTAIVGHRHFINAQPITSHLRGNLGLDAKTVRYEWNAA